MTGGRIVSYPQAPPGPAWGLVRGNLRAASWRRCSPDDEPGRTCAPLRTSANGSGPSYPQLSQFPQSFSAVANCPPNTAFRRCGSFPQFRSFRSCFCRCRHARAPENGTEAGGRGARLAAPGRSCPQAPTDCIGSSGKGPDAGAIGALNRASGSGNGLVNFGFIQSLRLRGSHAEKGFGRCSRHQRRNGQQVVQAWHAHAQHRRGPKLAR